MWAVAIPGAAGLHFLCVVKTYGILGAMGQKLAAHDKTGLLDACVDYLKWAPPMAAASAALAFCKARLQWSLRRSIQQWCFSALEGAPLDSATAKIPDVAERLTAEAQQVAEELCNAWSQSSCGVLLVISNLVALTRLLGVGSLLRIFGFVTIANRMAVMVTPKIALMREAAAESEAELRQEVQRAGNFSEEVMLWKGTTEECHRSRMALARLAIRTSILHTSQFVYDFVNTTLVRQCGTVYAVIATMPLMDRDSPVKDMTVVLHLLINAIRGIFDTASCFKHLAEAHGLMQRLDEAVAALQEPRLDRGAPAEALTMSAASIALPDHAGGKVIVSGLDIKVAAGQRCLVRGPNGAGKTSFLRVCANLWHTSKGSCQLPPDAACFFLPQRPYVLESANVRTNLEYGYPVPDGVLERILRTVGLQMPLTRVCHGLSGGEQQRLCLGRLLVRLQGRSQGSQAFIFLDEPTASAAPGFAADLYQALDAAAPGAAVVTVAHSEDVLPFHDQELLFSGPETAPVMKPIRK